MNHNRSLSSCRDLAMDLQVPGGVYMCQVSETVSCGACCGLYNVADPSRPAMEEMLRERTRRFATLPRTVEAIDAFGRETTAREPQQRPFKEFHHCPFIGLIGDGLHRVGCLLHPLGQGNDGVDFRGLSHYGGLACHSYFCPATRQLAPRHKRVLRAVIDDWHLYGLVVTEGDLVSALFHEIESRIGRPMDLKIYQHRPKAVCALVELLRLKIDWPHRLPRADTPCHYFFFDVMFERPAAAYDRLGVPASRYDTILRELGAHFHSAAELRGAEARIEQRLTAAVQALCRD